MIQSMDELLKASALGKKHTIAVACAQGAEVLRAVWTVHRAGIAEAILIGDEAQIRRVAGSFQLSLKTFPILHEPDKEAACRKAVSLIREGKASALMKGLVDTAEFMRIVLDRSDGLRGGSLLSHIALLNLRRMAWPLLLTDAALNIAPGREEKKKILANAVRVAHALGNPSPVVACLCAVEKVNLKMPATLDAAALTEANRQGELPGCQVFGPAALDDALFPAAARSKGMISPLAGCADILLAPDIEAGNMLYKAFTCIAKARAAGVIVGARKPIILASRTDSRETLIQSIALALVLAENESPREREHVEGSGP